MIYITRRERFNAAHKLFRKEWTDEQNLEVFGKCSNPNWHGHNYELFVTVKGEIDPRTGMLVDLGALQSVIDEQVIEPFDHTFLNKDIAYFADVVPTAENIAVHIQDLLRLPIEQLGAYLHKIKLIESPNNSCEVYCVQPQAKASSSSDAVLTSV